MLLKFSNNVLELPFNYSLRYKKKEDFENEINTILNHVRKEWGCYSEDEEVIEYDYGYEIVLAMYVVLSLHHKILVNFYIYQV